MNYDFPGFPSPTTAPDTVSNYYPVGPFPPTDDEMRQRLWISVYIAVAAEPRRDGGPDRCKEWADAAIKAFDEKFGVK